MEYERTVRAEFVRRPNRFVAAVVLDGDEILVHVKNTGRCREILVPGATVILSDSGNPDRKWLGLLTKSAPTVRSYSKVSRCTDQKCFFR